MGALAGLLLFDRPNDGGKAVLAGLRRKQVSVLLLAAMLGGAVSVPFLSVKSDPRAFFPDDAPFSSALRLFEEEFYVFSPLRVLVTVDSAEPLDGLRQAGELRDALAQSDRLGIVTGRTCADLPRQCRHHEQRQSYVDRQWRRDGAPDRGSH